MKYNFKDWLTEKIGDDREVILAGKLEYLRLYLTDAMRQLRSKAGLTQAQLAEKLGVQQGAVSQLESALNDRNLESVLEYLHALDADLLIAIKQGDELYQVSDNEGVVLVDVPKEMQELASARGRSIGEYVRTGIWRLLENLDEDKEAPNGRSPLEPEQSGCGQNQLVDGRSPGT